MSFGETRQIMADLQEIMALLNQTSVKTERIITNLPKTKEALMTFQQFERVALRYLALSRRMGLPDDVAQTTEVLTRLIITVRMLQMSMNMLMLGTPFGWLMGAAGLAMTGLSLYDSMVGY